MRDAEHPRLRELFDQALELPHTERRAFLAHECGGDATLAARVEALISAAGDERFLAAPTGPDAAPEVLEEGPGTQLGPYELVRKLGEGGFGAVFLARQEKPVARQVALKILKLGMDTRQVVARFEQERQALALMDHPNIARVIDAGATAAGRPYFVMDYVEGVPLSQYCDEHALSIAERLALFEQVCHAVQHAHAKGIIHRDLKPSNVLVATVEGKPLVKVIDFGIAKATSAKLTEMTLQTEHFQVIGTLQYMSPEQAAGSLDVDTRADVYALGAMLYELLTGSTPLDAATLRQGFLDEVQRMIREVDPPKPSTRLLQSAERLASLAALRRVEPRRLGTLLRGELDWIVMKALEKDRTRRYATASELAHDVRRYLSGEAVVAAPPSGMYRLQKFVRRNRGTVAAAAAVTLALAGGVVAFATQARVARAERDRARDAESDATAQRREAEEQRALAEASAARALAAQQAEAEQRRAAEDGRREAQRLQALAEANAAAEAKARRRAEATADFVTGALAASDPTQGGVQAITVAEAMQRAVALLDAGQFADEPDLDASLRRVIAHVLLRNGDAAAALPLAEHALATLERLTDGADSPDLAVAVDLVATIQQDLGRFELAEPLFVRALELQERLHPDDHEDIGKALNNLAVLRLYRGDSGGAEPLLERSLEMKRRMHPGDHPDTAMALNNLASVRDELGRRDEALAMHEESLAMYERLYDAHPYLAMALFNLGQMRIRENRMEEAEELLERALAMYRELYHGDHPDVARALSGAANVRRTRGRPAEAAPLFVEALEMRRRLFPGDHPVVANELVALTRFQLEYGDLPAAEASAREALAMRRDLFASASPDLAAALQLLASVLRQRGALAEAEELAAEAVEVRRALHPGDHPDVARALSDLAGVVLDLGRTDEALELAREAVEMHRSHRSGDSLGLAVAWALLGHLERRAGRLAEAEASFREALEMARRVHRRDHYDVAVALVNHAQALHELGREAEARAAFEEGIAMHRRRDPEGSVVLAGALSAAGRAALASGDAAAALPLLQEAVATMERLLDPSDAGLAACRAALAECRAALGR